MPSNFKFPIDGILYDILDLFIIKPIFGTNSSLWACGFNNLGRLGDGTIINKSSPIQVGSLTDWNTICAGNSSYSVKSTGTLWAWGPNGNGELGNGTRTAVSSPIQIGSLTNWKQVNGCNLAAHAIKTDGTLWGWGLGNRLGDGTIISKSSPIQIGSLTTWKAVAGIGPSLVALKTDGTIWSWGTDGYSGTLGQGTTSTNRSSPTQIGLLTNWKQVSCGYNFMGAVKTDGTLWVWGDNYYGQRGDGTTNDSLTPEDVAGVGSGMAASWLASAMLNWVNSAWKALLK